MNVLSLFDGIGGAKEALKRIGIKIDNYYASEIDKYAISIANKNHPDIIQLGDVEKFEFWNLPKIDLMIFGSPCQGFSFAGKGLNFKDPRSKLFFTAYSALQAFKPKYFLMENVVMKKEYQDIISQYLNVEPIMINSALVSAQNRKRLYWTNIPNITQPIDLKIKLKDILEYHPSGASFAAAIRGRRIKDNVRCDYIKEIPIKQYLEIRDNDGKSNCLTTVEKDNVLTTLSSGKNQLIKVTNIHPSCKGMNGDVYSIEGKSPTITTNKGEGSKYTTDNIFYRKLTPLECERLQTFPDNYTEGVSNTQRYKMLGNAFTVSVIEHILKNII